MGASSFRVAATRGSEPPGGRDHQADDMLAPAQPQGATLQRRIQHRRSQPPAPKTAAGAARPCDHGEVARTAFDRPPRRYARARNESAPVRSLHRHREPGRQHRAQVALRGQHQSVFEQPRARIMPMPNSRRPQHRKAAARGELAHCPSIFAECGGPCVAAARSRGERPDRQLAARHAADSSPPSAGRSANATRNRTRSR